MGLLLVGILFTQVTAQNSVLEVGDPPVASLISISPADENGIVTITGAPGAVFPAAQVAIRNLYTNDTVFTQAGITGSFVTTLYGPGNTPFWISPAQTIPQAIRNAEGTLPGGPSTIIYGAFPESRPASTIPTTQLIVDGRVADWDAYAQATLTDTVLGLWNNDAIYLATQPIAESAKVRLLLEVNNARYAITLDPSVYVPAIWQDANANRDLGTIPVTAEVDENIEFRIPLSPIRTALFNAQLNTIQLLEVVHLDENDNTINTQTFEEVVLPFVDEQNGIVYDTEQLTDIAARFSVSGAVAQGASSWHARVRIGELSYQAGDTFDIEMDVTLTAPDLPSSLVGLSMIGRFGLQPVTVGDFATSGALHVNNGWSTVLTNTGLAVDNLQSDIVLTEVIVSPSQVIRRGDDLLFGLRGQVAIPDDLPSGLYVPFFEGFSRIGDGDIVQWSDNGLFGEGDGISQVPLTRMPIVLRLGRDDDDTHRLLWTLFHDYPSDGSRGLLALEDRGRAALSNRVKFNSPTYILPPNSEGEGYPLEPYVVGMLPNRYDSNVPPLLPLLFPNGRINVTIQRPDGSTDNLASAPIIQNMLSTAALDEKVRFGEQSQVDIYRLTTLNNSFMSHSFTDYGEYMVELSGFVEDVWGNRYEGGGTYTFLIAELLDMSPMMMSGTPLEVGDFINAGLHVSPNVAADVSVRLRIFPLNGGDVIEQRVTGKSNAHGVFMPDDVIVVDVPGEYVLYYEARYEDSEGRLWAGSLRSAGVIASPQPVHVLRGERGLANVAESYRPSWYLAEQYTDIDSADAQLNMPYHSGDIAWVEDSPLAGVAVQARLQDLRGVYSAWLRQTQLDYTMPDGSPLERASVEDTLPLSMLAATQDNNDRIAIQPDLIVNQAYTYVSYMSPNGSVRQFVLGGEQGELDLLWGMDDPLNEQIGAGGTGARSGDYAVLFAGSILNNRQATLREANIYASSAMVIDENDALGARVFPPYEGAAGGPNGGALLTVNDAPVSMWLHPTATRPGNVLTLGDVMAITGQSVPTLPTQVSVRITAPSGNVRQFSDMTNAVGYFYQPDYNFAVDEIGVWTVDIHIQPEGTSSAGQVEPPFPSGNVLGSDGGRFYVYVVAEDAESLAWSQVSDLSISAGFPFNFTFDFPEGWTEIDGYVSSVFPTAIASDGEVLIQGTALRYQFNPTNLSQQFSFYEGTEGRFDGASGSDTLTVTFAIVGLNENGQPDIRTRQVTIRHDRLLTIE